MILSPTLENDRKLVSDISYYWVTAVKGSLDDKNEYSVSPELFLVFLLTNDVFFRSHLPVYVDQVPGIIISPGSSRCFGGTSPYYANSTNFGSYQDRVGNPQVAYGI